MYRLSAPYSAKSIKDLESNSIKPLKYTHTHTHTHSQTTHSFSHTQLHNVDYNKKTTQNKLNT